MTSVLTKDDIRASGGIVHSDGNVFFTSVEQLNSAVLKKLAAGVSVEPVNNDLADDISAIDCMYRGDPSYEHDAYYMREQAVKLVRNGYMLVTLDQLTTALAAARVQENERCAEHMEKQHVCISNVAAANLIRALLGKETT